MASSVRTISQQAFDAMVTENMDDLGMEPNEALQDVVETLTLQRVDLSGIVKCIPGTTSAQENPVIRSLQELKSIAPRLTNQEIDGDLEKQTTEILDRLRDLCSAADSDNTSIASRNGALELLASLCAALSSNQKALVSVLKVTSLVIRDVQSSEEFRRNGGAKIVVDVINGGLRDPEVLESGFAVVAAAAAGNEVLKESFMDLKIDGILVDVLREQSKASAQSLFDAIRVLLTPDDNRVVASQVFGYARRFAQIGIANALVDAINQGLSLSSLVSACVALKAVAVNDEICRSISENGGIDAVLRCIDDSGDHNDKVTARACCSLLCKLAGSDNNKSDIIQKGGLDRLMKLTSRFSEDPSVLQEVMSIFGVLSLRSPENAARALEAGAGDLAIQAMQKFPAAYQMQKQSCLMIRNLAVRSAENRRILLNNGIEKLIRRAKQSHVSCKDAATAALRDLGLDDYNT